MMHDSIWRQVSAHKRARTLERRWQKVCAGYLTHAPKRSMWRYHCVSGRGAPASGWKLHVSATILNAATTLERIAPVLVEYGVQFKAPRSLVDVMKLNSGLEHSYSQIGKVITVYPRNESEAVSLARRLHQLTRRLAAPSVPFDLRFADQSNVYYRFGALRQLEITLSDGKRVPAMETPTGELVPDLRQMAKPDWVRDPFVNTKAKAKAAAQPGVIPFRVLRPVVQRGKGGVYQAIDLRGKSPRLCLLKEGRRNGETCWDGRDGAWRVRHEERVLRKLSAGGVPVPEVHSAFALQGNYYLAMTFIDGETLQDLLERLERRMSLVRVLNVGIKLGDFLGRMHKVGWAWRDCKPKNIIITRGGELVPIDFEGAAPTNLPDRLPWGTLGFTPPECHDIHDGAAADVYALGAVLYLLLTGRIFDQTQPLPIQKFRRRVPLELRLLVESLMSERAEKRPTAHEATARLTAIFLKHSKQTLNQAAAKAA